MLRGRRRECAVFDGLLEGVRAGRSGALVVRGEAGVGKTALLEYAIESAPDLHIARAAGVESEMELRLPLHQLCAPMLDRLEELPGPQRSALSTTFGLREGRGGVGFGTAAGAEYFRLSLGDRRAAELLGVAGPAKRVPGARPAARSGACWAQRRAGRAG